MDKLSSKEKELFGLALREGNNRMILHLIKEYEVLDDAKSTISANVDNAISCIEGYFPSELEDILIAWAEGNRKFSRSIND